jgi:ubiquinone/menaquinone biosynthesis C-methylase UbiE
MPKKEFMAMGTLLAVGVLGSGLLFGYQYARDSTRRWFQSCITEEVAHREEWSESELDSMLHKLSRWDEFNATQFKSFVAHQIAGLALDESEHPFHFLEVGVGVGAFAREILRRFPNCTGVGFDLESKPLDIARKVLPASRMQLFVSDMLEAPKRLQPDVFFDYVFIPGSLCYLHSLQEVLVVLQQLARVMKPGGGLCASMLASPTSATGSCNTRIPKAMWGRVHGLTLVSMEEMDAWGLPHAFGRYAVCLRLKPKIAL